MDNCKLFLIDDDSISLIITNKFLKRHQGFHESDICCYSKPEEGLESVRKELSDENTNNFWILLDVNMPIMNGWDFLDGLQEFNSEGRVKVIMLTSSINDEDRDMAKSYASVIGFLSKPIDEEKVKNVYELINS